ncbi:CdaR family protein [Bacillus sp. T33-2]|uniref:CdaR family protein n=1 Tax=Bacillus sp. T33-2 TaxID=2054168 RepID=UPI000C765D10|nr:CdaR family protein [Bacillus sp. T33-2]PLR95502.1 hypothetical protein CVD19_13865 [Bacillus sp. T33-2]
MDKLMDYPWFMKAVALVLAVLLFSSVPNDDESETAVNVPSDENTETITDVQVKSYYDTENLVVSGVPRTVNMTIQGPKNIVQQAKALRNFEVYVDLTDVEIGKQRAEIKVRDISKRLAVTIEPEYVNVSVQEKVTKEFKVEAEFDRRKIQEGYIAGEASIDPARVKITGAKDIIDKISYVKATVDEDDPVNETISREADILVFDRQLNKLEVVVDPDTVEVTIPVKSSSKDVPINIVRKGTPPAGITIESMKLDTEQATIIAAPDILKSVDSVRVEVDVSNLSEDTELTLPVIISNGVVKVTPETAKVTVNVNNQVEKTISNVPIGIEGETEPLEAGFLPPDNGLTNVIVSGPSDAVAALTAEDFKLIADVSGLQGGDHQVNIKVTAPQNIKWRLARETASITVTEKEV